MKPMPWKNRPSPLLSDPDVHVAQLVRINQPETLRSALADVRFRAHYLIRGSRGTCVKDHAFWREVVDILRCYRHSARIFVRALNQMGEPTNAQALALP